MDRDYNDMSADDVIYFVGPEVEKTHMYGKQTLFKVGDRPYDEIIEYVNKARKKVGHIEHIYFTANHSLTEIVDWTVLNRLLADGYYVTVDGYTDDMERIRHFLPTYDPKLIIMLAIPLPHIDNWPYNTYIKLDDNDFNATNSGVWLHKLDILKDYNNKTEWVEYRQDHILATKADLND